MSFAYCHIATLAGRSLNTSSTCVHITCTSAANAASLRTGEIPQTRDLNICRTCRRSFSTTRTLWHTGAQFRFQSQRNEEPARASQPGYPCLCGHSCNCPAVRLPRLAVGIFPPWSFGQNAVAARSLTPGGSSRLVLIAPRLFSLPAEPNAQISPIGCREACSLALTVGTVQPPGPD